MRFRISTHILYGHRYEIVGLCKINLKPENTDPRFHTKKGSLSVGEEKHTRIASFPFGIKQIESILLLQTKHSTYAGLPDLLLFPR